VNDVKLTDYQRSMLCWLAAHDGYIPKDEGINQRNPDLAHEIKQSLRALGLVEAPEYSTEARLYVYKPTQDGYDRALKMRYSSGCSACVTAFCVCRVRVVCVAGCGNAGCHGSHD